MRKGKMPEAVRKRRLQITDVKWEPQKKQWIAAAQQRLTDAQEKHTLCIEEHGVSQNSSRQKKRMEEERTYINGRRHLDKSCLKRRKSVGVEVGHLLLLAQSAELLLESENNFNHTHRNDQSLEESQISSTSQQLQNQLSNTNSTEVDPNVEAEKNTFLLQGRTRLSQFRRLARLKNHKLTQEMHEDHTHEHVEGQLFEDAELAQIERVAATQGQAMHCQVDQRWCEQVESRRKQPFVFESQVNEGVHLPCIQHHITEHQLVPISNGFEELREQPCIAQRTNGGMDQLRKCLSDSQQEQVHALEKGQVEQISMIKPQLVMTEMQHDHHSIARERRLRRTFERRKQLKRKNCSAAQFHRHLMADEQRKQIHEAEQQLPQHMLNVQNEKLHVALQQREQCCKEAQHERTLVTKEQMASRNVLRRLNRQQLNEDMVDGGTYRAHLVTGSEVDKLLLEMDHGFQQRVINICHKDQGVELQHEPRMNVETEKRDVCLKGKIRLNQLRREARSQNTHSVGRKSGEPLEVRSDEDQGVELQNGPVRMNVEFEKQAVCIKGKIRLNQLRREARLQTTHSVERKTRKPLEVRNDEVRRCDAQTVEKAGAEQVRLLRQ